MSFKNLNRKSSRVEFKGQPQYRPEYADSKKDSQTNEKIWKLMAEYTPITIESIQKSIVNHVEYTLCKNRFTFQNDQCYLAVAHSVRDRLIESHNDTQQFMHYKDAKRIYYISLEFLVGRSLQNAISNLQIEEEYKEAILDLGYNIENIYEEEVDPGLGNGGLGRLAACFLDSLATLNYPAWGYGIRYDYGIFKQNIHNGWQVEVPDYWLTKINPWEIKRNDVKYPVRFYGHVRDEKGKKIWEGGEVVFAEAYDNPIPGYATFNSINLRLWKSVPSNEFDFHLFNKGDYFDAVKTRQRAEYISSVLYPNDSTQQGKELRLKQQYLFVSASIQDALRRFKKKDRKWDELPDKIAIQLNDTHPSLGIPEMMRILIDNEGLDFNYAFSLVRKTFAYTNHTVLPEALEKWPVSLLENLLPRHLQIIYEINHIWLKNEVAIKYPGNDYKKQSLSLVEEGENKAIKMAFLSVIGSHTVNGVAAIHSELIKKTMFKEFFEFDPKKFQNKTNGVTPRRWVQQCNPFLAKIYDQYLPDSLWPCNFETIRDLSDKASDPQFQEQFKQMKLQCKQRLVDWVAQHCFNMNGSKVTITTNYLFDIQVKRLHEYKRQFLNALYMVFRYLCIKETKPEDRKKYFQPRVHFVGGKAAPGYDKAKKIIHLINCIQNTVNNDPDVNEIMQVVFLPNYCVSAAQIIIPASDISEHISTAGTEASGTSNMKFVMNGGLIIGTLDGANIEIKEEVGDNNIFIFGANVDQIQGLTQKMLNLSYDQYVPNELKKVFGFIESGKLGGDKMALISLLDSIRNHNDQYLLCSDFKGYLDCQNRIDQEYRNQEEWIKKSIMNATKSQKFNSDRTIDEYANDIWHIKPFPVPNPATNPKDRIKSSQCLK